MKAVVRSPVPSCSVARARRQKDAVLGTASLAVGLMALQCQLLVNTGPDDAPPTGSGGVGGMALQREAGAPQPDGDAVDAKNGNDVDASFDALPRSEDSARAAKSPADASDEQEPASMAGDARAPNCPATGGQGATVGVQSALGNATTACGDTANDLPAMAAAIGTANFDGAKACGMCVRLTTRAGKSMDVTVVNTTSDIAPAHFTLFGKDYQALFVTNATGQVSGVNWEEVPCATSSNRLHYAFKPDAGPNPAYLALRIRGHRYRVESIDVEGQDPLTGTARWIPLTLQESSGYWIGQQLGPGPFKIRSKDHCGNQVTDDGVAYRPGETVDGTTPVQVP